MKLLKTLIITTLLFITFLPSSYAKANDKLHIITVAEWSDAMILESNGHYAMIDTGEDFSYPDGSDPRYPDREGITKDKKKITQDRLFAHIKQLGIKKFDFIIITHAHSDHVGSAHDVLKSVPTEKLYIKKYSDDRISDKTRLWDNLYGYERALKAAKETNTEIIQDISEKDSHLTLGDIKIDLLNYENEYESDGSLKKVYDDNLNSILAIVNINNTKIFLGGDLENTERHLEEKYAEYLKHKNISIINAGQLDRAAISLEFNNGNVKDISNDYPHYGFYNENNILKFKNWKNEAPEDGWTQHNDNWYYFFDSGTVAVGWKYLDNKWFYFNNDGSIKTGIVKDNNNFYYIDKNNGMLTDSWKEIDSTSKYYFKKDGRAAKNEWENFYHFEADGTLSKNKWIGFLHVNSEGRISISDFRNYPLFIISLLIICYLGYSIRNKKHRDS